MVRIRGGRSNNNNNNNNNNGYGYHREGLSEEEITAHILCSLKEWVTQGGSSSNSRVNLSNLEEPTQQEEKVMKVDSTVENFINDNNNPPDLPPFQCLENRIWKCTTKPLVKQVQESDVRTQLNRLFLKKDHVKMHFLPLLKQDESIEEGIAVTTYDIDGNEFEMVFKLWSNKFYVLNGSGWKSFFQRHELQMHQDYVTVWMFRHSQTQKLCFAIDVRRKEEYSPPTKKKRKERSVLEGLLLPQPMKKRRST